MTGDRVDDFKLSTGSLYGDEIVARAFNSFTGNNALINEVIDATNQGILAGLEGLFLFFDSD